MGRVNKETTNRNSIYKRQRNLDGSTSKLFQLQICLDVLQEFEQKSLVGFSH